ncbi:unnamed protein product, partial [Mesorhabditis belari]|uniref:Immunoglobulin I-set domain-containing protein n=1 Tax=Mesorhabditis belari TaxID=2138241 RepID=A0AAF3FG22_9BILA
MLSLYAALSLTVLYRATVNFPDLPYSAQLRHEGTEDFLKYSKEITDSVNHLLRHVPGDHRASVLKYRYHKSVGTLVSIDIFSDTVDARIRKTIDEAIKRGKLGDFVVTPDAYELHVIRAANSTCNPEEFACADGTCIDAKKRCDARPDCPDHSDERSIHAHCNRHSAVIFQKEKHVTVRRSGEIVLSAIIDMLPSDHQVIWSRNGLILGQGSLTMTDDTRIHVYNHHDEYSLHIEHANDKDEGEYILTVEGMGKEEKFFVSLSNEHLPSDTEGCPDGERACKSGHCIPVHHFCDRERQCPDGDDEHNCTTVICSRKELRCAVDNVCVPLSGRCDGWRDCADGTDELGCSKTKLVKAPATKSIASRPTVSCPDGTAPEYSLHGSTYCWANTVCPTDTECIHGLCCRTGSKSFTVYVNVTF